MVARHAGDPERIGPYEVLGYLGRGAQGTVYRARSPESVVVAVKRLHPNLADDDTLRLRFMREAEAASRVAGFCTARVLATGVADGTPYIVSEYIRGESLQERVDRDGPRSVAQLDRLIVGTLTALAAIHRAGIVHRDFKPNNVILGEDGPRVVDFGVARMLDDDSALSAVVGTPAYMAPEQFSGELSPAVDVFAWASTMYFAATGAPAFGTGSPAAVMYRVLHTQPDLAAVPASIRPVLARCLRKDPRQRPGAATLLLGRFGENADVGPEEILEQGRAVAEERAPLPDRWPRTVMPRRSVLAALGVTAAAIVGGVATRAVLRTDSTGNRAGAAKALAPGESRVLLGHNDIVSGLCFGRIGSRSVMVSASDDQTARVWDPSTGKRLGPPLTGHKGWVGAVAFSEFGDLQVAVTVGQDGHVRLWDLSTMRQHADLTGHEGWIRTVGVGAFKGEPIAVTGGGDRTVRIWNLRQGTQLGRTITGFSQVTTAVGLSEYAYRPVILVGDADGFLTMWDLETQQRVGTSKPAHRAQVNTITTGQHNGRETAFTAGDDMVIRGWDLETGRQEWTLKGHSQVIYALELGTLDERNVLVSGSEDGSVRIWDIDTGKQYGPSFIGYRGGVRSLAFGPVDGVNVIVSSGVDQSVRIWRP